MRRFCYALLLLILSARVPFLAGAQSVDSPKPNRAPLVAETARALLEDARATIALPATDPDGDPITVEIVTPPRHGTVTFSGTSATYVPHRDYYGTDRFTYRAGDGSAISAPATVRISVTPVDDPPAMISEPGAVRIREGEPYSFRYRAEDVEGSPVSYRLVDGPEGAELDPASGELRWTPTFSQSGVHTLRVRASDGELESKAAVSTIVVMEATAWTGVLSPFNLTEPVVSRATGSFTVTYVPEQSVILIDGAFADLESDRLSADASQAAFGLDAEPLIPLELVDDPSAPGPRNGTFEYPSIGGTSLPTAFLPILGIDLAELLAALDGGQIYVLVRSESQSGGELRAQLRPAATNVAPETPVLDIPGAVTIEGDPQSVGLTASWTAPVDPDGDPTRQIFGFWTGSPLPSLHSLWVDDGSHGRSFTTDWLAKFFDGIAGGGSGGSETVFPAVITTDGAHLSISDLATVSLVRGMVTAVDDGGLLPDVFMLRGNFPNPFNPTTTIQFDLPGPAEVEVYVTDLLGRVVLKVPSRAMAAGLRRQIPLDASILASGIYIYRVTARTDATTHVATGTMTLLK